MNTQPQQDQLAQLDFTPACDSRDGCDRPATWLVVNRCPVGSDHGCAFLACDGHADAFRAKLRDGLLIHCVDLPEYKVPYLDCIVRFDRLGGAA